MVKNHRESRRADYDLRKSLDEEPEDGSAFENVFGQYPYRTFSNVVGYRFFCASIIASMRFTASGPSESLGCKRT